MKKTSLRILTEKGLPVIFLSFLIVLWEILVDILKIPSYFLSSPSEIISFILRRSSFLASHLFITTYEIFLGYALGVSIGLLFAIGMVQSDLIQRALYPLLIASNVIPKSALAPLFLLWLGYGILPKIVIAALITFFPIVVNTTYGLTSISNELADLARCIHCSKVQMFTKIRLPNALPFTLEGLKISTTLAVVGAIVAEFVGADKGLGYLIIVANYTMDTQMMFASLVVLVIFGCAFYAVIDYAGRFLIPWYYAPRKSR